MKTAINSITSGAILSIFGLMIIIFPITAIIAHIWTVYIAFEVGGFISGIVTLFFPVLAEIYWMFKMFGVNNLYAYIVLAHLILALPFGLFSKRG